MQTEDLLVKRRSLLEKKIDQAMAQARDYTKAGNKRGKALITGTIPVLL